MMCCSVQGLRCLGSTTSPDKESVRCKSIITAVRDRTQCQIGGVQDHGTTAEASKHKSGQPGAAISSNSLQKQHKKQQKQRKRVIEQERNVHTRTWFGFSGFISRGVCSASAGIRGVPLQAGSTCPPPHQPVLWTPCAPPRKYLRFHMGTLYT